MYTKGGWMMIVGVVFSLGFIASAVWFVNNHINGKLSDKEWLTRYVAMLLAALVGLFIVDKIVSFKTQLLTDEMSQGLFELIKNIVLVIFGYQFNASTKVDKTD